MTIPNPERFWRRVLKTKKCWLWGGYRHPKNPYPRFRYSSKQWFVHRLSWFLKTGRILKRGVHLHHTCKNKTCVNPEHLVEMEEAVHRSMKQEFCMRGHLLDKTAMKTGKSRRCRVCYNANLRRKYKKKG